jgi:hypothetical protein
LPCDLPAGRYRLVYRAEVGGDHPILEGLKEFSLPLPRELVRVSAATAKPEK